MDYINYWGYFIKVSLGDESEEEGINNALQGHILTWII